MGSEIGQPEEWHSDAGIRWDLLAFAPHRNLQRFAGELNRFYRSQPALYEEDFQAGGFEWVDFRDVEGSVISFVRYALNRPDFVLFCCNFTPVPREGYRIGVPEPGIYTEIFNTDAERFGGSNAGNPNPVAAEPIECHGRKQSVVLTLPPLAVIALKRVG